MQSFYFHFLSNDQETYCSVFLELSGRYKREHHYAGITSVFYWQVKYLPKGLTVHWLNYCSELLLVYSKSRDYVSIYYVTFNNHWHWHLTEHWLINVLSILINGVNIFVSPIIISISHCFWK